MKKNNKQIFFSIFFAFVVIIYFTISFNSLDSITEVTFASFKKDINTNKIEQINYDSGNSYITAKLKDGTIIKTDNPNTEESKNLIFNSGTKIVHSESIFDNIGKISNILFYFISIVIAISIFKYFIGNGQIGKSMFESGINTNCQVSNTTFNDFAGCEESKEALQELVFYLKHPDKYKKYGVKPPKGAIIYGPPGTGKTLLAKALAGESGANFIAVTGSNFVDKFVGNGASRVRHLFEEARKKIPCIIFIDEIDAVGGKRDSINTNDERQQTLNELLSAMNGFSDDEGIIIIGATNRLDSLDEALLRSGRFDTKIYIGLPDVAARKKIFLVHSKNKPIDKDVDYDKITKMTAYFSGADIENVMNKAGFYAAREDSTTITMHHIDLAISNLIAGDMKKDRSKIKEEDRRLTAYHEAGHAIVAKLYCNQNVPKITIIPTTLGAGGYTLIDTEEKMYKTKKEMEQSIAISLAGRIAEHIIYGKDNVTIGASSDIKHVTDVAISMIKNYGMSEEFGMLSLPDNILYEKDIIKEAKIIVDKIYEDIYNFLDKNKNKLDLICNALLDKEVILEDEFNNLLGIENTNINTGKEEKD